MSPKLTDYIRDYYQQTVLGKPIPTLEQQKIAIRVDGTLKSEAEAELNALQNKTPPGMGLASRFFLNHVHINALKAALG